VFLAYVCDDMTLSQIAKKHNLSREGVRQIVMAVTRRLQEFTGADQL
jgi:DNA-directed RNA polymerase sigma subunit (sigma70/sigma32)